MPANTIFETALQGAPPQVVSTLFDELTATSMLTGPWSAGPIMFQELRDELIFIAPPVVVVVTPPRPTVILQANTTAANW